MESILLTIKKMLGITDEYEAFDQDIIININMAFNILSQLGVRPADGYAITDSSSTWSDFIGDDKRIEMIKTYIYLKVKQAFDPSASSVINSTIEKQIEQLEWRINVQAECEEN